VYVLDTNTLIYFFKGMGRVAERLLAVPPAEVGVPAVVLFELRTGIAKSAQPEKRSEQLAAFCRAARVLPFGEQEADAAALVRAGLEAAGRPIGPYDVLIAGTALAAGGVLVTRNTNEFHRVDGLRLQDWYA
jgi:tRNA(fMet)-specific endonuclease VapC